MMTQTPRSLLAIHQPVAIYTTVSDPKTRNLRKIYQRTYDVVNFYRTAWLIAVRLYWVTCSHYADGPVLPGWSWSLQSFAQVRLAWPDVGWWLEWCLRGKG